MKITADFQDVAPKFRRPNKLGRTDSEYGNRRLILKTIAFGVLWATLQLLETMFQAIERTGETRHRNSHVGSVFPVAASLKCVAASDRTLARQTQDFTTEEPTGFGR